MLQKCRHRACCAPTLPMCPEMLHDLSIIILNYLLPFHHILNNCQILYSTEFANKNKVVGMEHQGNSSSQTVKQIQISKNIPGTADDYYILGIQQNLNKPESMESMNLITIEDEKIKINQQAIAELAKQDGPISVVCTCGDYRTGKSFLLNTLFNFNCFDVSPTTQPCTKGINMSKNPLHRDGKTIWVFDTEGFGSMQQQGKYDGKIFLLAILLSEALIYNSVGSLDEQSISKMGLMCKQAIGLSQILSHEQHRARLVPDTDFYWVLRDFGLSLVDKHEAKITPNTYLEQSLSGESEQRKLIKRLFKHRKCFPIVRPCISEEDLQCLRQIPEDKLRPQFVEEIERLREDLVIALKTKTGYGRDLSGREFVELMKVYVQMINDEGINVNLSVTWEHIQKHQKELVLEQIIEKIEFQVKSHSHKIPLSKADLTQLKIQIRSINRAHSSVIAKFSMHEEVELISQKILAKFLMKNQKVLRQNLTSILEHEFSVIGPKIISVLKTSNYSTLIQRLHEQIFKLRNIFHQHIDSSEKLVVCEQYINISNKVVTWLYNDIITQLVKEITTKDSKIEKFEKENDTTESILKEEQQKRKKLEAEVEKLKKIQQKFEEKEASYSTIIQRMEKVNENFRNEFKILELSEKQNKQSFQTKILELSENLENQKQMVKLLEIRLLENQSLRRESEKQTSCLKEYLQELEKETKRQLEKKRQGYIGLISVERQNFEQLMNEKNEECHLMRKEIAEIQQKHAKIREDLVAYVSKIEKQCEQKLMEKDHYYQEEIDSLLSKFNQSVNSEKLLKLQNEKLYEEIDKKIVMLDTKGSQFLDERRKVSELQSKLLALSMEMNEEKHKYEEKLAYQVKISEQNIVKAKQIQTELKEVRQKHMNELESLSIKLHENMENYANSSKQKYEISKREYEIEHQQVANKLIEAAQRIESLVVKEKELEGKIMEFERIVKEKEKNCEDLRHQNSLLQQRMILLNLNSIQESGRSTSKQRSRKTMRASSPQQKSAYQKSQDRQVCEKSAQEISSKQSKSKKQSSEVEAINPELSNLNANQIGLLIAQNEELKVCVDVLGKQAEKWRTEMLKKVNLHSLMKKMNNQEFREESKEEQEKWKVKQAELNQKLSTEQRNHHETKRQLIEMEEVMLNQRHELANLSQQLEILENRLCEALEEKQLIRNKGEDLSAHFQIRIKGLEAELEEMGRKYNGIAKEVSIWRIKGSKKQTCGNHRQKINELFNFL